MCGLILMLRRKKNNTYNFNNRIESIKTSMEFLTMDDDIVSGCLLKFKYRMCIFADDDSKRCAFHCYSFRVFFRSCKFFICRRPDLFSCQSMQFKAHLIASFNRTACTQFLYVHVQCDYASAVQISMERSFG